MRFTYIGNAEQMEMNDSESAACSRVCNMDNWEDDMNEPGTETTSISRVMTNFSSPEPNTNANEFANAVIKTMRNQPGNDDERKPNQGEDPELQNAGYEIVKTTTKPGTRKKRALMVTHEYREDVWYDKGRGTKNSVEFRRLRSTALNVLMEWCKDPKFSKNNASQLVLPTRYNKDVLKILEKDEEFAERVESALGFYRHGSHVYLENSPPKIADEWIPSKIKAISAMILASKDPKVSEKSTVAKKRRLDAKKTEQKVDAEAIECPCSPSLLYESESDEEKD